MSDLTMKPIEPPPAGKPVVFRLSWASREQLIEMSMLLAQVIGEREALPLSATIRSCIDLAYQHRGILRDLCHKDSAIRQKIMTGK